MENKWRFCLLYYTRNTPWHNQPQILSWTVSLTICDCRPIRCTSHDLESVRITTLLLLFPSSYCTTAQFHTVLFIFWLWQREHSYNEMNWLCLYSNNGLGLRSDHNCESRERWTRKRSDRGAVASSFDSSLIAIASDVLAKFSLEKSFLIYAFESDIASLD